MKLYPLLIMMLSAATALAALPESQTFSLKVIDNKIVSAGRGAAKYGPHGNVTVHPEDKCIYFEKTGDYLEFHAKGNISNQQGTIAFWVKDFNTAPDQRVWNPYFQWSGKDEVFNILRAWQPFEIGGGVWNKKTRLAWCFMPPWPKATWQHLALTYQSSLLNIYLDGKLIQTATNAGFVFNEPGQYFTVGRVGPHPAEDDFFTGRHLLTDAPETAEKMKIGKEPYGAYGIKDFAIFERVLTSHEIKDLVDGKFGRTAVSLANDELTVSMDESITAAELRLTITSALAKPGDTAEIRLLDAAGKAVETQSAQVGKSGIDPVILSTAKLAEGKYTVSVRIANRNNQSSKPFTAAYEKKAPFPWVGNQLGAEDVVLPGFEPLETTPAEARIYGRTYRFGKSLLPQQIVNQNVEVLTAPINWQIKTKSGHDELKFDQVKLESSSPTRAVWTGTGRLGSLNVSGKVTVEYDGYMYFEFDFMPPAKGTAVDSLRLNIPLAKGESTLLFHEARRSALWENNWRSAVTPLGSKGMITLANPDRSLQWMIESDQYFFPEDNPNTLQTSESGNTRTFTVAVIDKTKQITEPFKLNWIMQAGPVKARPKHWRGWTRAGRQYLDPRLHNLVNYNYDWWSRSPGEPIPAEGFPAQPNPDFLRGKIPNVSLHFGGFRETREKENLNKRTPEWRIYEKEWQRIPVRMTTEPGWNEQTIDTKAMSWGEWHVWCVNELFRTTGVRGLYYDDWLPGDSKNELAGSGYIGENGIRRGTRDIRNQREIHRRVYALVKKYRPGDGIVYLHVSGCPIMPILAFADIDYDGEVMVWSDRIPPEGRYFDSYRMDIFQMLFSARQFGNVPGFHDVTTKTLDVGGSGKILLKQNQRQLWALLLLHDNHLQSAFTSGMEEVRFAWLDAFGIAEEDVDFCGYWNEQKGAELLDFRFQPDTSDIDRASKGYISVYTRPGKALLIIVRDAPNNYAGAALARVKLDLKRLGFPENAKLKTTNMESHGRTKLGSVEGDILSVPVECDDFTAVLLETE